MVYSLVQQLLSGSPPAPPQAVAGNSFVPPLTLTPQSWLSAVGDIPRLVQLLDSTAMTAPRYMSIQQVLQHISNYH